jgi:hypothetical protein
VLNSEGLDKVLPVLAAITNESGATPAWPASKRPADLAVTEIPIFIHALVAGLVPPFSDFFNAILSHYQILVLHLDPGSVTLLSTFAFLCEAMVGIIPSVALFRHFFSLQLVDARQRSGCVAFRAEAASSSIFDFSLHPMAEGFRKHWVYVDATTHSPLLQIPEKPAAPNSGWVREELTDRRAALVWQRLDGLKKNGVTAPMVVREFITQRIAPLQRHSRPMWTFSGPKDRMRLQVSPLPPETLRAALERLIGDPTPAMIPAGDSFLYTCPNPVDFVKIMPLFDEWGLRPKGLEGPRENPVVVVPMLAGPATPTPDAGAGGCAQPDTLEAVDVESTSRSAPEASARAAPTRAPKIRVLGAPTVTPEVASSGAPMCDPEAAAPDAPMCAPEVTSPRAPMCGPDDTALEAPMGAPEVASSGAPMLVPDADAPEDPMGAPESASSGFRPLRPNFKALRKRKWLPGCSADGFRPLKQRRFIEVNG